MLLCCDDDDDDDDNVHGWCVVCVPQQDQQIVPSRHIRQVAQQLTDKDVLKAHLWMELGIDTNNLANPLQVCDDGRM